MAEYGDGRSVSSRDVFSAIAMQFIDEYVSLFVARTMFPAPCLVRSRVDNDDVRNTEDTILVRF